VADRHEFDPAPLGARMYALLNSVVVPRPIAWVATRSAAGVDNLAPHSYFTVSSVQPPVVQFTSVGTKDSLTNIRETGEFVVHVVTRALAEAANVTATDFPRDQSEFGHAGLSPEPARTVSVPRLTQSPVALECRAVGERSFGDSTVVFGEVLWVAIDPAVLADDDLADIVKLAPVARLGRDQWAALGEVFELRRVPYRERQKERS
jgi:flavin reductase (DIM6/NTAB) family NADH-FMN oxidoreductase RutF